MGRQLRLAARLSAAGALAAFWLSDLGTLAAFGLPVPPLAQVAAKDIALEWMTRRRVQFVPDIRKNWPPLAEISRKWFARGVIQPEKVSLNAEQPVHDPTGSFPYYGPTELRPEGQLA